MSGGTVLRGRVVALTFDLWNTLYVADGGYDRVRPRRVKALRSMLAVAGIDPSDDEMQRVFRSGFDAYMQAWTEGRHYGAPHQALHFLESFGVDPETVDAEVMQQTVVEIEEASRLAELELLPGVSETIPALATAGYRLGIISDTSLTPGRVLCEFLENDGLLDCFAARTFSDETGYPKPDRRMFESTLEKLGACAGEALHIGDTPRTDIAGAKAMGMVTVRCAAAAVPSDRIPH